MENITERTWPDEEGEETLHECNDCGSLTWYGNELCSACIRLEDDREYNQSAYGSYGSYL